jgi:hypothetical protein
LCVTTIDPSASGASVLTHPTWHTQAPAVYNNSVQLNLIPGQYQAMTNPVGVSEFTIPAALISLSTRWFGQLFVEELDSTTQLPTGNWAASRGCWIGVVQ